MVKKCSNCYWCQEKDYAHNLGDKDVEIKKHIGCYAGGKWRKWISKRQVDIPNDCPVWKEIPEIPF